MDLVVLVHKVLPDLKVQLDPVVLDPKVLLAHKEQPVQVDLVVLVRKVPPDLKVQLGLVVPVRKVLKVFKALGGLKEQPAQMDLKDQSTLLLIVWRMMFISRYLVLKCQM